jgi:protein involved in polysaccharide export with SLBB domain
MFRFKLIRVPSQALRRALGPALLLCVLFSWLVPAALAAGADDRDFPPLVDPNRPAAVERAVPVEPGTVAPPPAESASEPAPYRLGVGDEIRINVLTAPELSGVVKVRPDGAISTPGAGMVHALGRSPEEVGRELETKLGELLRHPRVDVVVTNFGEQRVFVLGEVPAPGDKPYYKGMSALQAIAAAGGVNATGKAQSVLVIRRTGTDAAEVHRLDLAASLKGATGQDMAIYPFDIVYVPRTFIAGVDLVIDQYIRQLIPPFTLYMEGWKAFNIGTDKVRVYATQ